MKALARVAVLTLGFLSAVPAIRAAETPEVDKNTNAASQPFDPDAGVSLRVPFHLSENFSLGAVTEASNMKKNRRAN